MEDIIKDLKEAIKIKNEYVAVQNELMCFIQRGLKEIGAGAMPKVHKILNEKDNRYNAYIGKAASKKKDGLWNIRPFINIARGILLVQTTENARKDILNIQKKKLEEELEEI